MSVRVLARFCAGAGFLRTTRACHQCHAAQMPCRASICDRDRSLCRIANRPARKGRLHWLSAIIAYRAAGSPNSRSVPAGTPAKWRYRARRIRRGPSTLQRDHSGSRVDPWTALPNAEVSRIERQRNTRRGRAHPDWSDSPARVPTARRGRSTRSVLALSTQRSGRSRCGERAVVFALDEAEHERELGHSRDDRHHRAELEQVGIGKVAAQTRIQLR